MTTAPAINNIADLYRIIDEQPEWGEALRSRLLGAELLAMPRQLAQLTEETRALRGVTEKLVETAAEHTLQLAEQSCQLTELRRISETNTEQLAELRRISESHTAQLAELTAQIKEHTLQLTELRRISDNQTARMGRIESDTSNVKGIAAQLLAEKTITAIAADMDLYDPIQVPQRELLKMARQLGLDKDTRQSFVEADIVFQAQTEEDNAVYGAVEVSWTADFRDTSRARRNAELLAQATGDAALSIVAGNRWVYDLDWTGIHWFQLSE